MRERVRRLPAGNLVVRGTVLLLGALFIGLGLVAIVLPGPFTIPPVVLGLVIWSLEFDFAKRLLQRVKAKVRWSKAPRLGVQARRRLRGHSNDAASSQP